MGALCKIFISKIFTIKHKTMEEIITVIMLIIGIVGITSILEYVLDTRERRKDKHTFPKNFKTTKKE